VETQVVFQDLGLISYNKALEIQFRVYDELCTAKKNKVRPVIKQHVFLCEHPHVYTIGKSGSNNNILISKEKLKELGAEVIRTDRGGDITYHGPGQIVCYPVLDLEFFNLGIKEYVYALEKTVIALLKKHEITGSIIEGAPGVWIDADKPRKRKICSVGVKESRKITMHGLALNVNTDLNYFQHIHPCGFSSSIMTSMKKEKSKPFDISLLKQQLMEHLKRKFEI
jgi:lipoyl(octanoyl) transferase